MNCGRLRHRRAWGGVLHSACSVTGRRQLTGHVPPPLGSKGCPQPQMETLALGQESAPESSPQATAQDRLCPESTRHRPQPARDRQEQSGQTPLSPSSLSMSQEGTSTGLPPSACPHMHQLERAKLCTGITHSVHIPSLAEPSCLAQRTPRQGSPTLSSGPKPPADRSSLRSVLLFQLATGTQQYHPHCTPMYFHSTEASVCTCLDKTRLGYQLDPKETV